MLAASRAIQPFRKAVSTPTLPAKTRCAPLKAYVELSVATAITQQALAYVAVLGGEAAYTRTQLEATNKGRPEIVPVAAAAAGTLVGTAIVNSGIESIAPLGCITGMIAAGAMMYYTATRIQDTTDDEDSIPDWPGPKAWPSTMCLISFFQLMVFFQGLRAELALF
eukprot:gene7305-422_t